MSAEGSLWNVLRPTTVLNLQTVFPIVTRISRSFLKKLSLSWASSISLFVHTRPGIMARWNAATGRIRNAFTPGSSFSLPGLSSEEQQSLAREAVGGRAKPKALTWVRVDGVNHRLQLARRDSREIELLGESICRSRLFSLTHAGPDSLELQKTVWFQASVPHSCSQRTPSHYPL